jgi:hypothetical protein
MAITAMVGTLPSARANSARVRKRKGGTNTGSGNATEPLREEVAARTVLDGVAMPADLRGYGERMMAETRGEAYKPIMEVIVAACALRKRSQRSMHKWFLGASQSFRSSRLRGWRAWILFCGASGVTLDDMRTHESPEELFGDFLAWADEPENDVADHVKREAAPAEQELFDVLRRDVKLTGYSLVRTLQRNLNTRIKAAPKNTMIWPISIFTQYARECPDPEKQPWPDLMGLSAAVLSVFLPCRPIALIRMDVAAARTRLSDGSLIVPTQEKTDSGRGRTELIIRSAPESRLSPRYYYDLLIGRARGLGVYDALFCSEKGRKYKRSDCIGKALKRLLLRMGVKGFTGYSFRHSTIQALFDAGLDEKEVNAYTGHSNNAHTAVNYYFHLDKAWAGERIRTAPSERVPLRAEAIKAIEADDEEI